MSRRKVYSGPILILGAVQLIESLAFALPLSFFPNYVLTLGASVASVGLFTSSFMIAFAVMSPRMGGLVDRYGRKRMMVYGIASDVLFGTITGLAPTWQWLLLIRLLNGAVSSAAMLATETYLVDIVEPARRGEAMGFLMRLRTLGILDETTQEDIIDKAMQMAEEEVSLKEIKTITVLAMFANSQNEWRREFDCLLEDDWPRLLN